jgi:rhodanese-related sulfurtransferase
MTNKSAFKNLVNDAKLRINECSIEYINNMTINNTFDGILIDIRELSEYEDGYISHSIHISRGVLEAKIETLVPNKEQKIYLYCGGGYRSALSADNLMKMGYKNTYSIAGGYRAWQIIKKL